MVISNVHSQRLMAYPINYSDLGFGSLAIPIIRFSYSRSQISKSKKLLTSSPNLCPLPSFLDDSLDAVLKFPG